MSKRSMVVAMCALLLTAPALASSSAVGSWTAAPDMAVARAHLTATGLDNGRVLAVGGVGEQTTELYDPVTGVWLPGGTLSTPRWLHVAVRLANGRVLVAGGGAYTPSAELYNPATNTWT